MKKPIILSFITALLLSLGGIATELLFPLSHSILLGIMIATLLPLVVLLFGILFSKRLLSRIKNTGVAEGQAYLLKHREKAAESAKVLLKTLRRLRIGSYLYNAYLALCALFSALICGVFYVHSKVFFGIYLLYTTLLILVVASRFAKIAPLTLKENAHLITREKYPSVIALVDRAKEALEIDDAVTVLLTSDCNATIVKDHHRLFLQLGVILLQLLDQDELYAILLHEFSHVSKNRRAHFKEYDHNVRLLSAPFDVPFLSFLSYFFAFFDYPFIVRYSVYQYAHAVIEENDADRTMAEYGDPKAAASALVKIDYESKFSHEEDFRDSVPLYADENVTKNHLSDYIDRMIAAFTTRHAFWDELIASELLANNATHPTLAMRLEALGIKHPTITATPRDDLYQRELDAMLAFVEERFQKNLSEHYEADRRTRYLEPLARITAWEAAGCPIVTEEYADVISDLEALCRFSDAEALCDRVIDTLPDASSHQAYFNKGLYLLHRYDERGVDYLYHAIEQNHNYLEDGLFLIGSFYCMTGKEKELQDYRERAVILAQKNKDENSGADFLSRRDKLTRDDMPEEMKQGIVDFILSVGDNIVENIYLVRKTVSERFFTSVFIVHFYGGTDKQRGEIMHKIFRYLDSYPVDWQFSLFDYFDYPEIKVDKIDGALIYSKKNKI